MRLHEILSRLGEICLSPELAHAMLFPGHALAFVGGLTTALDFPDDSRDLCHDPRAVLLAMDVPPPSLAQAPAFLAKFIQDSLPSPTVVNLRQPIHLCAWRLESPSRACLFTGHHPVRPIDPADFAPHTLSKVLLEERSKRPTPSAIHLVPEDDISANAARKSLLHYAQTALTPHRERVGTGQAQDTTLEEAVACLIHAPSRNHTQIELTQSPPWEKDHIDSRFAETQTGANGLRYRDWLCVYASHQALDKCRLEAHILDVTTFHQALTPWRRGAGVEWACARSSLPLEQRVLHDRVAPGSGVSRFQAFVRSCKARLLQDIKCLPVREARELERRNVTAYVDELAQQFLVVYAPTGQQSLEFVCMTLQAQP